MTCLVMKLAAIMAVVERIPKRGRNEFHKYDYATEADIVAVVRLELARRHVMLLPAVTGALREPVGERGMVLTHLTMEFTFYDGESGETITRPWLGAGTDKEDKGAYKAMTGGEKYFLLKTFLMPTGDDPEQESKAPPAPVRVAARTLPAPARVTAKATISPPPGYLEWLAQLSATAASGTARLQIVWNASPEACRVHLQTTDASRWAALQAQAAAA